ncbi:MAG: transcriptional regulator [Candidatus Doudnabacteria bacterium]|nr:transcriptional regulator [Candidatus Doudnabacteria bacterium]
MRANKEYEWELTGVVHEVAKDRKLLYEFLQDLLSPYEFMDVAVRWQIVKQLYQRIPQRRVARNLHVGVATVTRGARELADKNGGFNQVLRKFYGIK